MDTAAKLQGVKIWSHISQLKKPKKAPLNIGSGINTGDLKINLTMEEIADIEVHWFPPKILDQEHFFSFLIPSLTILFLIFTT